MLTHAHQFCTLHRLDDFRRDDWNFISGWCTAIHSELFSPAHVWCVSVHVLEPSLPISCGSHSGVEVRSFGMGEEGTQKNSVTLRKTTPVCRPGSSKKRKADSLHSLSTEEDDLDGSQQIHPFPRAASRFILPVILKIFFCVQRLTIFRHQTSCLSEHSCSLHLSDFSNFQISCPSEHHRPVLPLRSALPIIL